MSFEFQFAPNYMLLKEYTKNHQFRSVSISIFLFYFKGTCMFPLRNSLKIFLNDDNRMLASQICVSSMKGDNLE